MQSVELISLKDLIANSTAHPLGARTMRMLNTALAATPSAVDVPPDDLFALVHKDKQAPSSTVIAAVSPDDLKNEEIKQQLNDVMMLTSFISVAASRRLYQTTYKDAPPDITTGPGAAALVKAMANAKNQVLTSALSGYLSSESLVARSFSESTTSADLHFEFLKTLFDGFNFPKATINELDSVLTSVTQTIGDLHLSWSDQSSTLDHMVFLYYFDSVMGVDVKVPKVRIYFLHIDQKSWSASIGKSSVTHFEFNMNFSDGIYTMDVTQTAKDRAKIQGLLEQWTAQNLEDLNKLLSPKAVDPSTPV